MIKSYLQSCLAVCSKSLKCLNERQDRKQLQIQMILPCQLQGFIHKNKSKGVHSSPSYAFATSQILFTTLINCRQIWAILSHMPLHQLVRRKEVLVFNHWNYYGHFKDQGPANLQQYVQCSEVTYIQLCLSSEILSIHAISTSTQVKNGVTLSIWGLVQIIHFNFPPIFIFKFIACVQW